MSIYILVAGTIMSECVHIVATSPWSGTTLMMQLLVNCFEIDGFCSHEMSIFNRPHGYHKIFCVKKPIDILNTQALLAIDSHYGRVLDVRFERYSGK